MDIKTCDVLSNVTLDILTTRRHKLGKDESNGIQMRHLHTRCCKKRKKTNRNATINAVVIAQIDFDVSFSLFRFVSPQNSYCAFLILIDIVRPQTKSHMPST